ncbi:hypothetical protein OROMI_009603 [Orobanche minor]
MRSNFKQNCSGRDLEENRWKRNNVAAREFYCYLFQIRANDATNILRAGRLVQQHQIDCYVKIETQRLDYFRSEQVQHDLRIESFEGIIESMACDGNLSGEKIGQKFVLPSSYIGSPRDMQRRYLNALALVSEYGKPDFFITVTCNPNWPEIREGLLPGEEAQNRSDLVARIFRARNEEFKNEIVTKKLLGEVAAYLYVIEFQKRGLPHAHWIIILKPHFKIVSAAAYDRFVSAEIPDIILHPHLHSCVVSHMMHGPCGLLNPSNVCMRDRKCKNRYPKDFVDCTSQHDDSYPMYRRRNDGRIVSVRHQMLDNRWVVPYNPYLLAKFDCHINVEICVGIKLIKYLYKYVCKGTNRIAFNVVQASEISSRDEITDFQSARWLCAPEAMWRIYAFVLSEIYPPVLQLHVHLPNKHHVLFSPSRFLPEVIANPNASKTQLTEFFRMNAESATVSAMNLLYKDFPRFFVWDASQKNWHRRLKGTSIGRLVHASPTDGERYYLRLLLTHVRAPTSFDYLKTYNSVLYSTFRAAALARGLLHSDIDVTNSITEASLWNLFKFYLADDYIALEKDNTDHAFLKALQAMDVFLQSMGRTIDDFDLVDYSIGASKQQMHDRDFYQEQNYVICNSDLHSCTELNSMQNHAFKHIMQAIDKTGPAAFFVDGPAGSGKRFLYRAILAAVRSKHFIALAVASSGVAASLLPGGRTAHSRFKLPVIIEDEICTISKQSVHARLIIAAKLIIWDEASMAHRKSLEALDTLLRDLMENNISFGGKTIVFGADFRQTIPIIPVGTREDAIAACLINSPLWPLMHKIRLTQNMRSKYDAPFRKFLLEIGNGTEPCNQHDEIKLPVDMCLPYKYNDAPLTDLLFHIFPDIHIYPLNPHMLINRAILTPKNNSVDDINDFLINKFPGTVVEYYSTDLTNDPFQQSYYQDYLNSIQTPGLPSHLLRLKKNCPIMLLRNINPSEGLCNGTRLICRDLGKNVISAEIATGQHVGNLVFIPRIPLEPSDKQKCPIPFKRHQFPVRLCFAMTFNKSQGQTLDKVGLYLPEPVFSHGQLYVALSRARKADDIKILIRPPTIDAAGDTITKNIVYREIINAAVL